jgi:nicotinamide-nucleotide amidase
MQNLLFHRQVAARRGTAELNAGNRRMAMVPAGALLLRNGPGMAPGLAFPLAGDRYLIALPGVPAELRALVENFVEPTYLDGARSPTVAELHYEAAPESAFHDAMRSVGAEYPELTIGSYPQTERGELILRVSGLDADRVRLARDALVERVSRYRPLASPA